MKIVYLMKNNNFEKRDPWPISNKNVRETIEKNEIIRNLRAKLVKRKINKPSTL